MLFRQTQLFQLCPCADDLYLGHTLVRGKDARAPVNLQCCVCTQCTTISPFWTISVTNRPANALKRPGGAKCARPGCAPQNRKPPGLRLPDGFLFYMESRFTCPPAARPARLSGRGGGFPPRQRSRPRAARTGRWRSPRPGGRADSAAPARWALRFPADGR